MISNFVEFLKPIFKAQSPGSFWMPPQASTTASNVDFVFYFITGIAIFFFVLIVTLMVLFIFLYRRREGHKEQQTTTHNTTLEMVWTIIPLIIVIIIFYFGFKAFMDNAVIPANAYEIKVYGQKWNWNFMYPKTGHFDQDLHVPVDTPVKLTIISEDVTHSLFIPAFRLKMDAVPGRYTYAWFRANQEGEFPLYCAEYCGTQHSDMTAMVVVHPPGEFEKWLREASDFLKKMPPAEAGERLYQLRGCKQCHSIDGTSGQGPSLKDIWGEEQPLRDGSRVVVDENYIRESLLEPNAKVVAGYDAIMPTAQGKLSNEEIDAIIEFIKSIGSEHENNENENGNGETTQEESN